MDYRVIRLIRTKALEKANQGETEVAELLDGIADRIEDLPELTAKREKTFTQIHKDSPVLYPTWKCGNCGFEDRTAKRSTFCKMCGWRFSDDE